MSGGSGEEALFEPIGAAVETSEMGTMSTESMCPECQGTGETRLMLVTIPFFKEVIVASFECRDCGFTNSSVQFGGAIQPMGCVQQLSVQAPADMNRQVVKSEFCTVSVPELELEIPCKQGEITTVEGILSTTSSGLSMQQPLRRIEHPELAAKIDDFLDRLQSYMDGTKPFTVILRDPSGNSHIQNYNAPHPDPQLTVSHFRRSAEDDVAVGLATTDEVEPAEQPAVSLAGSPDARGSETPEDGPTVPARDYNTRRTADEQAKVEDGKLQLGYSLPELCYACKKEGSVNLAMVNIPHFKETVIMSFKCEHCGFTTNEIKSGGEVPEMGTKLTLQVRTDVDLCRDVLKSHSCTVSIPEIDFEMSEGSLGAMFTTVEGLVSQMHSELSQVQKQGYCLGDSSTAAERAEFLRVLGTLDSMRDGKTPFTLILDDPLSHSYIQSTSDDPAEDPQLVTEKYERTPEMNEELGINFLIEQEREAREAAQA